MNDNDEKSLGWYINKYKGAIIGGAVALLFVVTGLSKLLFSLILIVLGILLGYYIQNNKDEVKEKLKNFIDRV